MITLKFTTAQTCMLSILLSSVPAFSAQMLPVNEQERLTATISSKELNRLQVVGERIASVFGTPNAFSLEHEDVKGQVFLKVHDGAPPRLDVSVVTESGLTQDLLLKVNSGEGQTLLLKPSKDTSDIMWNEGLESQIPESVELIRLMVRHTSGSGYLRQHVSRALPLWRDVRLTLIEVWKGSELEGRVYKVTNTSDAPLLLQESQFCLSSHTKAIALQQHRLKPGDTTTLWEVISHV